MQKLRYPAPALGSAGAYWLARQALRRLFCAVLARQRDALICLGVVLFALCLYAATLLPGIGDRDTAELQRVVPMLGLAHPTGYPLYTLLGWLWSQLLLGGTPAWRMNLFSALAAALAVGAVYLVGRALGQRPAAALAGAAALAVSRTFWSQATIAEVYALAALLQAALLLALLGWRAGRLPLWAIGLALGLGLAHHRSIVLMLPGTLLFVGLEAWRGRRRVGGRQAARLWPQALSTLAALLGPCLLYLYLPLHAPPGADPWRLLWDYASGADVAAAWLDPRRLWSEGGLRLLDLGWRFVWPQLLPAGALLALLGAGRLLQRDRGAAALLLGGYVAVLAFCAAYYVGDVEVFFIPAHLIAALLIGEGAMLFRPPFADSRQPTADSRGSSMACPRISIYDPRSSAWLSFVVRRSSFVALALPVLLLAANMGAVRAANRPAAELAARALLAEPLPAGALVIGDWSSTEGPRYLQAVEGLRPDLQIGFLADRDLILDTLARGRAVYLLNPLPELGLAQYQEGRLWRVDDRPLAPETRAKIGWQEGIVLSGYTLPHRPCHAGAAVPITLGWLARAAPRQPYTLFVHLIGPDGRIWGQVDRPPTSGPTDRWRAGDRAVDLYAPVLDPAAPPGRYRVTLGWYAYPSLQRLPLAAVGGAASADYITLGEFEVAPKQ